MLRSSRVEESDEDEELLCWGLGGGRAERVERRGEGMAGRRRTFREAVCCPVQYQRLDEDFSKNGKGLYSSGIGRDSAALMRSDASTSFLPVEQLRQFGKNSEA